MKIDREANRPVTMREVASKAGVSPVVVSRVLHNKAKSIRVSEATAERVRQAADELGYRCNVFARNFRAQRTMTIGVLHGSGVTRPRLDHGSRYFAALVDGLVEGAFNHGYSITLCPRLLSMTPEDAMCDGRFDGLVWYSTVSSDEHREMLANCAVPLVLLHASSNEFGGRHPSVICDNDQGIGLAVDHLVELGHRRIAFAMDVDPVNVEALSRLAAFGRHLQRHGIVCSEEDVLKIDWSRRSIERYVTRECRHTAVIAHNEGMAADFMAYAQQIGLRVPEDLSIVGFDSTAFCNELRPAMTAIHQPLTLMGSKAIDLLIESIEDGPSLSREVIFPCRLDIRGSTCHTTR